MSYDEAFTSMQGHWHSALAELRQKLSAESFEAWLEPIRFTGYDGARLCVRVPNRFYAEWNRSHYQDLLIGVLKRLAGAEQLEIEWKIDETLEKELKAAARPATPPPARSSSPPPARASEPGRDLTLTNLNQKYRFETFVVGPSNQLAHAAAMAAASSPGTRYNPLFIYGGVGLGKTHLVNAVGHRILQDKPSARIVYVSAERFTNEFIWALQNHRINEFRDRYRNQCDALLMDDIQFLATREQTQEEFFHTFNALYHSDRQIVVSSDAYPQQIGKMEERLISRFQWGMVADVQAPELDTRVAIVRKKAEQEGISLSVEVANFLAQSVKTNVRELEGTLLRLAVKADLLKRPLDVEFAREALRTQYPPQEAAMSVDDVQRAVCEFFGIKLADLKSHRRHRSLAHPRMIAMYLCRQRLHTSYTELGERFGGKDHTTVLSAVRKIEGRIESEDTELLACLQAIEQKLKRG